MFFEDRYTNSYAEPVLPEILEKGSIYFALDYNDDNLLIPSLETLVYLGENLEDGDVDKIYFQDLESYLAGVRYNGKKICPDEIFGKIFYGAKDQGHIFEFEKALEQLLECYLRRNKIKRIPRVGEGPYFFTGRQLNVNAEPVFPELLEKDSIYFAVDFVDEEKLIPTMDTRVYIGENLEEGDKDLYYFQDMDSYREGLRHERNKIFDDKRYPLFHRVPIGKMGQTFEFEKALEELMKCSIRRKINSK